MSSPTEDSLAYPDRPSPPQPAPWVEANWSPGDLKPPSEGDLERLSRPFTRLDASRSQANGAGLGLAIVERIVKRHHGSLRLANRSTGGLRITISLPLAGGRA